MAAETETVTSDLEGNTNGTTPAETDRVTIDLAMIGPRVIDREEIGPIRIDRPFVATTVHTTPTDLRTEATTTAHKATVPLIEAEKDPKATDPLIEVIVIVPKVIALHIEVAAEIDPVVAEAFVPAAADALVAAVDLGPAVVAEGPHTEVPVAEIVHQDEIKVAPVKKARKPKQSI